VNYAKGLFGMLVIRSNDKRKDGIIIWTINFFNLIRQIYTTLVVLVY